MPSIQSLGVGAEELKLNDMFDKLEKNEKKQLKRYQDRESDLKRKTLAWDSLKKEFTSLQQISADFISPSGLKTVSSGSVNFEARVTGSVPPGEYDIVINQLAQSQVLSSGKLEIADFKGQSLSDRAKANLSIVVTDSSGQKQEVVVPHYKTNLNNIISEINRQQSIISAGFLKNDDGSYQIIFSSKESGASSGFFISTDDVNLGSHINYELSGKNENATLIKEPQDAKIEINGMDVQRSSNFITDAPNGLSIELKKPGTGRAEKIVVSENLEGREKKIKDFIEAFNETLGFLDNQTTAVVKNSKLIKSPLFADQSANIIKINLVKMASTLTTNTDFIGVFGMGSDGKIKVNEQEISKLASGDKLSKNSKGNSYSSFLSTMKILNENFTNIISTNGIISSGYTKVDKETNINNKKMTELLATIDLNLQRYKKQFTELSIFYNKLNNSSFQLHGLLDNNNNRD